MGSGSSGISPSASASVSSAHNDSDVAFATQMIPHHQQAVEMADMVLAKTGVDPRVTELAKQIKAAQDPEIVTMTGWLKAWGAALAHPDGRDGHERHDVADRHGRAKKRVRAGLVEAAPAADDATPSGTN